ncbi:MAG: hypothetical protein M3Z26_02925 [Bacteroidota bacterium]|nr:hypothetical protein [Bacteroidota bacterium]
MRTLLSYCLRAIFLIASVSCNSNKSPLPSLKENYRKTDKLPFGSFVAYNGFENIFYRRTIEIATVPFDETWYNIKNYSSDGVYSLYFIITRNLLLTEDEVAAFMDYIKAGNDLFIAADFIDKKLLDALYCNMERHQEIINEVNGKMHETHVSMYFGKTFDASEFGYYYFPFLNSITDYDTTSTRVLGVNEMDQPDYAVLFFGRGRVYLHVAPRVFSNYFLLTKNNFHYFQNVISYLRLNPKNIYWDEYYKNNSSDTKKNRRSRNDSKEFSSLNVIQQNPPLLWAFWLALGAMLIYIFFNIKRKQRAIDMIKPNNNATVAFAETIGRLYFQQKNNRHIADKMITYFYEFIRNKYFIDSRSVSEAFINSLFGKSGVSKKDTDELFALIKNIQEQKDISDEKLLELNFKIENFTK